MGTQLRLHSIIYEKLFTLLKNNGNDLDAIRNTLENIELEHNNSVYSHLIYLLSHLFFKEKEAKKHWENIIHYKEEMENKLGFHVDYRAAMLSYFLDVKKQIRNPKIIEIRVFEQTQQEAFVDRLTGLYNYRYFMNRLCEEIKRIERYGSSLSLVMLDIDDFKLYNDWYGHLKGNEVLFQVSKILLSSVRNVDIIARYGGEEFVLVLPETPKDHAYVVAERIRKDVEKKEFIIKNKLLNKKLTISGGIATYGIDAKNERELIEKTDNALYVAKSRGKNNIALYSKEKRQYVRFDTAIRGSYTLLSQKHRSVQTINISAGGVSFKTKEDIPESAIIGMTLEIPLGKDLERRIQFDGKVIRVKRADDHNEVGIKILYIDQKDKVDLINYIKILECSTKQGVH